MSKKAGIDFPGICVAAWCHDGRGKFLFLKRGAKARDGRGLWEIPGGELEMLEAPVQAIIREVQEEICVRNVVVEGELGFSSVFRNEGESDTHWISLLYILRVDPSEVSIGEPDKISEVRWCSLDDLPQPLGKATRVDMEKFRDKLQAI